MEIDRSLSSHDNFYHDEKAGITLDPFSAPYGTRAQPVTNCQENKSDCPSTKVECYFDGEHVGYQLFFDGSRAGYEPTWSASSTTSHCASMKSTYEPGGTIVDCLFDGYEVPNRRPTEWNDGLSRDQVRPYLTVTSSCTAAEKTLLTSAYYYLMNRTTFDGNTELGYCVNEAFLLTNPRGFTGRQAAELFRTVVNMSISCGNQALAVETGTGARDNVTVNRSVLTGAWTSRTVAGLIAHEIMHNRGLQETGAPDYYNSIPAAAGRCVGDWWPSLLPVTTYNGYSLFRDNALDGQQPEWTKAQAADNCQWNKTTYPSTKVQCVFSGVSIGYELYRDGVRSGCEPKFTRQQALDNC